MQSYSIRLFLLCVLVLTRFVSSQADTVVLTEDFSGSTNIFGVTNKNAAQGTPWLQTTTLDGFGTVLAVCKATAEGNITAQNGSPVEVDGIVTIEWDAFHGYLGSNLSSTVSLLNSEGQSLVSYEYNCQSCKVTSVTIGNQPIPGFEAFSLQNRNGFGGNGKPYTATGNPHISVVLTARGGVTLTFYKDGAEVKKCLGSMGSLTKDVAKMVVSSTVTNTDRCYAIDNIRVSTGELVVDPNYIEGIASTVISGAEKLTFGPSTAEAFQNSFTVNITGTDGTNITEETIDEKVTDFKVVWDIEGFKTANDTEGQYCDSYGSFSVNGEGKVATTFDLRDVPMNFFGRLTATITYNGTTTVASRYVVALGDPSSNTSQVLPLGGYPINCSDYPDALVGYKLTGETYGAAKDLIVGGWCVSGSDAHQAVLQKDGDSTGFVRLTASQQGKSHVMTQKIESPSGQMIFKNRLRFNDEGGIVTLTAGYPFWSSKNYSCPVALLFKGGGLLLNNVPVTISGSSSLSVDQWYDIVLSADKSSECCYVMVYDTKGKLLGQSGVVAWTESASPTYFSVGMDNSYAGSIDMASYEAYIPVADAATYTLTADKTRLSIPQGESAKMLASVSDTRGYPITGQATWSIQEEDMRQSVVITPDAVDSHQAVLSMTSTAEAGTATVRVSIGGTTKTLPINLTSSAEAVKFTQSTTNVSIPMDAGGVVTTTFAAIVVTGDGTPIDNPVTLAAFGSDGLTPFTSAKGITFDAASGQLTVTSDAVPMQLIIRATGNNTSGEQLSKSVKVNIHGMKFDFGSDADDADADGFTVVSATTAYNAEAGYGISAGTPVVGGSASVTDASTDYLQGNFQFDFKVTKGDFYEVTVTYQGTLTTGYVNGDLAGYTLATHHTMTTETFIIPATMEIVDLRFSADNSTTARVAQISVTKQAKRQKRSKRVVHHIGDSTSANGGSWANTLSKTADNYPELTALCSFQNNGRGGRNLSTYYTQGLLANVLKDIYPGDILMLGNMGTNGMGSSFEADVNYYLNAAEALGAKVILNSYTPHGAVSNYSSGYNSSQHTFNSYRKDSYETVIRRADGIRAEYDKNYIGFVEIGKNADAAFNAYVSDYAKNGYANADAAAQAIISCFTDHNHYSNGTLACELMLKGYGDVKGIVAQLVELLKASDDPHDTSINTVKNSSDKSSETIFTLSGRRVASTLRPGIYIQGGRKILVRR